MDPQLHTHDERQIFVHLERQNPNDLGAGRREPANEQHDLQLEPAPMLLKSRSIVRWSRIRGPFSNWL